MRPLAEHQPAIGGYEPLAQMSAGGMGQVLLARRHGAHGFNKLVAVKTIRADLAPDERLRSMFLDEARLMARLDHPAIAQVLDFGEDGDTLYMVLELVAGVPLTAVTDAKLPPLSIRAACELAAELCRGLHSAHEARNDDGEALGVVHRDVSPPNVLLTFEGTVKIIDFGIAKVRNRMTQTTEAGQIKGKPSYMSPEQLNEETVDRRTDIFAVSTILHELLTRKRLFQRANVGATMMAVLVGDVPVPSLENPEVSEALDAIVMRGLKPQAQERWATALEMAEALEIEASILAGESLKAYALAHMGSRRAEFEQQTRFGGDGEVSLSGAGRDENEPTLAPRGASRADSPADLAQTPSDGHSNETRAPSRAPRRGTAEPTQRGGRPLALEDVEVSPPQRAKRRSVWLGAAVFLSAVALATSAAYFARNAGGPVQSASPVEPPSPMAQPTAKPEDRQPAPPSKTVADKAPAAGREDKPVTKPRRKRRKRGPKAAPVRPVAADVPVEVPAPPPPVGSGKLNAYADPFARVHVDGQYVGDTPLMGFALSAGEHAVQLIRPDTGEVRVQRTVTIRDGASATVKAK